tara:strand:+ start:8 stop:118 length:111 start_codon:yes stop_codon:yes gene_type:complete
MNIAKKQWMAPVATEIEVNTGTITDNYEDLSNDLNS